jgi:riboflavin biosynthesis pyrimidine reductase
MPLNSAFRTFCERKTREAEQAVIHPLVTIEDRSADLTLRGIGNDWTRRCYDGDFHLFSPPRALPAVSLVFVQSREGNTGIDDPEELGGGATDKHLIYEGLSRVAADAVLAGAASAVGKNVFFSLWHPKLVALRRDLGLPRHPAQVVISKAGRIDVERTLLFNVPGVPVFVLAGAVCRDRCADGFAGRPWITILPMEPDGVVTALARLRHDYGIQRISAVGGRSTASSLFDAGVVQDLCLTTTARSAGEPNTPYYIGRSAPSFHVIVRKRGTTSKEPILLEHLALEGTSAAAVSTLSTQSSSRD